MKVENNRLIDSFMGDNGFLGKKYIEYFSDEFPVTKVYTPEDLEYNLSWDWLMPVVVKIQSMSNYEKDKPFFSVGSFDIDWSRRYPSSTTRCRISICTLLNGVGSEFHTIQTSSKSAIDAVWQAVVEFIQWYKQNQS